MQASWWPAVLACALLAACQPPAPRELVDRDEVRQQAKALAAISGEADLFAQQVASHSVNRPFVWVHQQALSAEAGKAADALQRPAADDARAGRKQALDIASQLKDSLSGVPQAGADALPQLRGRFAALKAQAEAVEKAL